MRVFLPFGKMKQIALSFTEDQYKQLKNQSKITGCSMGSIVRSVLSEHFFNQTGGN